MTDQQTTDFRSEALSEHANAIYAALCAAREEGFIVTLHAGWALNLTDEGGAGSTPLWSVGLEG